MAALCLQLIIPEVWVLNGSFAPRCFPLHNLKLNFASAPPATNTNTNATNNTACSNIFFGDLRLHPQLESKACPIYPLTLCPENSKDRSCFHI